MWCVHHSVYVVVCVCAAIYDVYAAVFGDNYSLSTIVCLSVCLSVPLSCQVSYFEVYMEKIRDLLDGMRHAVCFTAVSNFY